MQKLAFKQQKNSLNFKEQIKKEPFYEINQALIMKETKELDITQNEKLKQIFMRIIYLVNQGIQFSSYDKDILYFRITKLFASQNQIIRRNAGLILKALSAKEFSFILLSCIARDIISDNDQLKLNALKLMAIINDEVSIVQIERLWEKAIMNQNQLISNAAIVVGVKLFQKFPHIIKISFPQILNQFKQEKNPINYHAFILLYMISKGNEIQNFNFTKLLYQNIKKDANSLLKIHLIKFIKENILSERDQYYKKEFIKFILVEVNKTDKMIALEAAKALIQMHYKIQMITCILQEQFEQETNDIARNFVLQLYLRLVNDSNKLKVLTKTQIEFLQNQCYQESVHMSYTAIKICLIIHQYKNMNDYLAKLYISASNTQQKVNFLNGLTEFIINNPLIGQDFDIFIQKHFESICEFELLKSAIQFLQYYMLISQIKQDFVIKILLKYVNTNIQEVKYVIIYLIKVQIMKLSCPPPMDENQINEEIKNILQYYQEYFGKSNQTTMDNQVQENNILQYQNNIKVREEQEIETTGSLELEEAEECHLIKTIE